MKQWEYKTDAAKGNIWQIKFKDFFNEAGKKGWELVTVLPGQDMSILIYKREKSSIITPGDN